MGKKIRQLDDDQISYFDPIFVTFYSFVESSEDDFEHEYNAHVYRSID